MTFDSYLFLLVFFPLFTVGFYGIRHVLSQASDENSCLQFLKLYLILGSVVFFAGFGLRNGLVFAASVIWNTVFARLLIRMYPGGRGNSAGMRRILLFTGIAGDVISLFLFKYVSAFLPIAISFYTFQGISLLADIYNGETAPQGYGKKAEISVTDCVLYLVFFPKVLQGPITRYRELVRSFDGMAEKRFDADSAARGFLLLTLGLSKKVLLADVFGKAVTCGYGSLDTLSGLDCLIVALSYSFQIYLDFSGYSDMAMGITRILQIELPLNFDRPYTAVSISDIWKKWHISLTKFLTRYLYIPLGGNRVGRARLFANIITVFVISGLWHGSGWGFVIWGLMHGLLMAVERVFLKPGKKISSADPVLLFIRRLLTFLYVTAAWVFFRAPDVRTALTLLSGVFTRSYLSVDKDLAICFRLDELWYPLKFTPVARWENGAMVCLAAFFIFTSVIIFRGKSAVQIADRWKLTLSHAVITGLLFGYSVLCLSGVSDFIYLNF